MNPDDTDNPQTPGENTADSPQENDAPTEEQDAIGAVPLSPEPTPRPEGLKLFFIATRAYSYPASIVPVLLGTALAARGYGGYASFDLVNFLLTLLGAMLAQAGGNVINDYYDFLKGIDTRPEHGSGVLPRGWLTTDQMRTLGIRLLLGGGLCGYLILARSPETIGVALPLTLIGLVCATIYTTILKRVALGDLTIMIAFGLALTLGAYGVQTPVQNAAQAALILLLALPLTLLVDAILHANNIRDAQNDTAQGYTTVASLLGPQGSQNLQALLLFGPLALVVTFIGLHLLPVSCLATLLALPLLLKAYKTGDVPLTAQSHLVFGVLYALSVLLMARP